ncbi:uncharacterized protein [Amphiura filiformis]|uniref:uncharacterized protein n=1 Tax=Amphiura filiformis TaxID=82378 RepID=UPI003B21F260
MFRCCFWLVLIAIHGSYGSHFRGGSMSWKPLAGNKIELTYRVSYKFHHTEPKFDPCTVEAAEQQTSLHSGGDLVCQSCVSDEAKRDLDYICTDYDVQGDWSIGKNVMVYNVPPGQNKFSISYENCCWLRVVSPDTKGGIRAWNMETEVNVTPRPELDGRINSSPVTGAIPIEKYSLGCTYNLKIPVTDPDNDMVQCKYYQPDECGSDPDKRRACGKPTSGLKVNKLDCSLEFNAAVAGEGAHAVNVMIRDCPNRKCKQPYSKIPLLFLLNVTGEPGPCMKPTIIIPPSCNTIRPDVPFEMVIEAEAGDASKPISRIVSQKPHGMTSSPMEPVEGSTTRKSITLSWTPSAEEMGKHTLCFSALDSDGFTSGRYCTYILVSNQDPIKPDPETSTPARDAEHGSTDKWVIKFNGEVTPPSKGAFIRILNEEKEVIYEVNVKSKGVTFSGDTLEFTPVPPNGGFPFSMAPVPYTVQIDEGVALPANGGCMSEPAEWNVLLKDNANFAILPLQHCSASSNMGPVDPDTCDIFLREMLPDDNGNPSPTEYNLCCTCIGQSYGPPGPPAGPPAGPPGTQRRKRTHHY